MVASSLKRALLPQERATTDVALLTTERATPVPGRRGRGHVRTRTCDASLLGTDADGLREDGPQRKRNKGV